MPKSKNATAENAPTAPTDSSPAVPYILDKSDRIDMLARMDITDFVRDFFKSPEFANDIRDADFHVGNFCLSLSKADDDVFKIECQLAAGLIVRFVFCNTQEYKKMCAQGFPDEEEDYGQTKKNKLKKMKKLFPMTTFQGEVIENGFHNGKHLLGCVVEEEKLQQTIQSVYSHFLYIFPKIYKQHIKVNADSVSSATWLLESKPVVHGLILSGNWQNADFEHVVNGVQCEKLTIRGIPPIDMTMKLNVDEIELFLEDKWLTEEKMMLLCCKRLDIYDGKNESVNEANCTRYNKILNLWRDKKAFDNLEDLRYESDYYLRDKAKLVEGGLKKEAWDGQTRPKYIVDPPEHGAKYMQFEEIDDAWDVQRIDRRLGTFLALNDSDVRFVVWKKVRSFYSTRDLSMINTKIKECDEEVRSSNETKETKEGEIKKIKEHLEKYEKSMIKTEVEQLNHLIECKETTIENALDDIRHAEKQKKNYEWIKEKLKEAENLN